MRLPYFIWNLMHKPAEVNYTATAGDIIYKIDNLYCCCQVNHGDVKDVNNIIIYSKVYNIRNIKSMFKFIIILKQLHGIDYIRVESSHNRYKLFKEIFGNDMLLQALCSTGRDVYWCRLSSSAIIKMMQLS